MMLLVVGYVRIPDEMTITEYDEINVGKTYVCQALVNYGAEDVSPVETEYSTSVKLFNILGNVKGIFTRSSARSVCNTHKGRAQLCDLLGSGYHTFKAGFGFRRKNLKRKRQRILIK